jgi:hypothetical protein
MSDEQPHPGLQQQVNQASDSNAAPQKPWQWPSAARLILGLCIILWLGIIGLALFMSD